MVMSSPVFLAVVLSLISAICYATAAVVQERTAADTEGVRGALARRAWWGSVALNGAGALLHVVALRYGPLTLVQPLGALSLVVAVPLGALVAGRRTSGGQWRGMTFTLAGLIALLTVTASGGGPGQTLGTGEVVAVALVAAAVIAVLARPVAGGLALAAASGIASGVGSTLAQKLVVGPTLSWSTALVTALTVVFAVGGLLLSQQAYRSGLGGPLALLTLLNPVTASAIGLTLLGEGFQYGSTGTLLALAGGTAAIHGVTLLSRGADGAAPQGETAPAQTPAAPARASTVSDHTLPVPARTPGPGSAAVLSRPVRPVAVEPERGPAPAPASAPALAGAGPAK